MLRVSLAATVLALSASVALANDPSSEAQSNRIASRVVETVIWGMPDGSVEVLGPEKPLFEKTWKLPDAEEIRWATMIISI